MATTESARHQLYRRISEIIGSDEADTLMELLPPVGWADVATKSDLAHLAERTDLRFDAVDQRFEQVDRRFEQMDRRFDAIDQRFEQVDQRFEQVDQRFEQVDQRFEQVDQRFYAIDRRFDAIDRRFDAIDHRLDAIDHRFDAIDHRFERIDGRFVEMEGRFATQASLDEFRVDMDRRFAEFTQSIGWRFETVEARMLAGFADLRTELHRSLRVNLIVTVGFLGTLVAVVGALTSTT